MKRVLGKVWTRIVTDPDVQTAIYVGRVYYRFALLWFFRPLFICTMLCGLAWLVLGVIGGLAGTATSLWLGVTGQNPLWLGTYVEPTLLFAYSLLTIVCGYAFGIAAAMLSAQTLDNMRDKIHELTWKLGMDG